ncbi:MAG: pyridoxamine 5'-phosphate oxidase family protein [Dehalococcoidia bacterium]|nr:pyridoxamine 5'-phosphate oxidase family protein [Dehalococcoidia bacterium]
MDVSWQELAPDFHRITGRVVWCSVTTVDGKGRPRSRILHPVWDGATGWIATGRDSFKARHIKRNPFVSLSYWDQEHEQVYAECKASWADDQGTRSRVLDLVKNAPLPIGYDPALFWQGGPSDPAFGALRLEPWRVEVWSLREMMQGKPSRVWRQ